MSKYKKQFKTMLEDNSSLFMRFKKEHDEYGTDKETFGEKFNEDGNKVLRVIRRYEDALCAKSENTGFGKFSENLSEKFWDEIRVMFPLIDEVKLR